MLHRRSETQIKIALEDVAVLNVDNRKVVVELVRNILHVGIPRKQ